jgi:hypothetical protein
VTSGSERADKIRFVNSLPGRRDDRLLTIVDGPVRTVDLRGRT